MPTKDQILARFNGDEEAMREFYREMQRKSRLNYNGSGGFRSMKETNPKRFSRIQAEASKKGSEKRKKDAYYRSLRKKQRDD